MDKLILGKLSYLLLFSESRQLDVKTLDGPYNKKKKWKHKLPIFQAAKFTCSIGSVNFIIARDRKSFSADAEISLCNQNGGNPFWNEPLHVDGVFFFYLEKRLLDNTQTQ